MCVKAEQTIKNKYVAMDNCKYIREISLPIRAIWCVNFAFIVPTILNYGTGFAIWFNPCAKVSLCHTDKCHLSPVRSYSVVFYL